MSELPAAPAALRDSDENLHAYGRFRGPIEDVSTAAWDAPSGGWRRRLQRKTWIYTGVYDPDFIVGIAVADVGYLATAFTYVFHRASGLRVEEAFERPFGFASAFAPSLKKPWALGSRHKLWVVEPHGTGIRVRYRGPKLSCDVTLPSLEGGMSTLAPSPHRPFNYTFKRLCLPATVSGRVEGEGFEKTLSHGAAVDFTLGYAPRHTHWNWACLQGTTDDGRAFGLNLVAHFNSDLENALWLGDALIPLGRAGFSFERPADQRPWTITVADLDLTVTFTPEGARQDRKNFGVLQHDFIQPYGRFTATLRHEGKALRVEGHGVVEDHTSRW